MVIRLQKQKQFSWQQIVTARLTSIPSCTISFQRSFAVFQPISRVAAPKCGAVKSSDFNKYDARVHLRVDSFSTTRYPNKRMGLDLHRETPIKCCGRRIDPPAVLLI
jgi:hypothetical protein